MSFFIQQMTIVGVGLIGGSLARALKERAMVGRGVGVGRNRDHLKLAAELGVIDKGAPHALKGVDASNLVVTCTPVSCRGPGF